MVLNIHAFDPRPEGLPAAQPMSYDGETTGDREYAARQALDAGRRLGRGARSPVKKGGRKAALSAVRAKSPASWHESCRK